MTMSSVMLSAAFMSEPPTDCDEHEAGRPPRIARGIFVEQRVHCQNRVTIVRAHAAPLTQTGPMRATSIAIPCWAMHQIMHRLNRLRGIFFSSPFTRMKIMSGLPFRFGFCVHERTPVCTYL